MAEIHGELHTTCRILRAQEISPSRSLSAAVIFSELSSCQRRTVASWGNRGRDGYVLGKPLNLSSSTVTSDLQPSMSRPFPKQPTQSAKLQDMCLYLGHGHFGMCILIICRGGRGHASMLTGRPERARLDSTGHAENNPTNHMASLPFDINSADPNRPGAFYRTRSNVRRKPHQQLAICSGSSQRRNNSQHQPGTNHSHERMKYQEWQDIVLRSSQGGGRKGARIGLCRTPTR